MKDHLISQNITLLEALARINKLAPEPLVLFVLDDDKRMVGTLTDGDARRALIVGAFVNDKVERIMHRNFNYMKAEEILDQLNQQPYTKELEKILLEMIQCCGAFDYDRLEELVESL